MIIRDICTRVCISPLLLCSVYLLYSGLQTHTHTHTQAHTYTQAHTHGNMMTALPPSEKWQMLHLWCQALVSEGQLIHLYAAVRRSWRLSGGGDSPRMEAWFSFFFFEWSGSWSVGGVAVEGVVRLVNPILNHQGSQHSDILENHICTRGGGMHATHTHTHTHTHAVYLIQSSHTHTHTLEDTQNEPRRKLNCACFIIWAVQCFSQAPVHCNGVMYISLQPNGLH